MNEIVIEEKEGIESMIYEVRGVQVMLDSDLAKLYECKNGTKEVNQAVKNNKDKFPIDFYFQLTQTELRILWSKNLTANKMSRILPHVFTEQGIAMLATVLHTKVASSVSINIMRAFVIVRKYVSNNILLNYEDRKMLIRHDSEIKLLQESFDKLNERTKVNTIFYEGQIYDAYSLLIDILSMANKEVIIIDNYAGKELLDILKVINVKIIIVSKNIDEALKNKYVKQYNNVKFINSDIFHDRFIIIDRNILYHSGASFKDLGKKCFAISKIDDSNILNNLLKNIQK